MSMSEVSRLRSVELRRGKQVSEEKGTRHRAQGTRKNSNLEIGHRGFARRVWSPQDNIKSASGGFSQGAFYRRAPEGSTKTTKGDERASEAPFANVRTPLRCSSLLRLAFDGHYNIVEYVHRQTSAGLEIACRS